MKTKVKVDFYKPEGKWYTDLEFETNTPCWDTLTLLYEIREKAGIATNMHYTFEAESSDGINKRLEVVK